MSIIRNVVYKDVDLLFDVHPVTRKLNTLTNNRAISRALKTLVLTDKGERPYQPFLGGNIRSRLFDLASNGLQIEADIKQDIEDVIRNYEPRAELIAAPILLVSYLKWYSISLPPTEVCQLDTAD